jgi:hypothetical protein
MSKSSLEKVIIWQKWKDPFGEKDDDIDVDDEYSNFYTEEGDDLDEEIHKSKLQNKHIKVIATPMGIVPINENTASGKIFNFWIGHTNFNITKYIADIIEKTDGVETLDIFTRYRFRIAIGKAFTDSSVMKDIQESIYSFMDTYDDQKS